MPSTGGNGYGGSYDTATNTFRPQAKPLPTPRKNNRQPFPNFGGPLKPARPFVKDNIGKSSGPPVQFPKGVSNGKY